MMVQSFFILLLCCLFIYLQFSLCLNTQSDSDDSVGYFDGLSYVKLNKSINFLQQTFTLGFKTCQSNGTFLHQV